MGLFRKLKAVIENLPLIKHILASHRELIRIHDLMTQDYMQKHVFMNPKYRDSQRLNKAELQAFSQNGEDGLLAEIFRRIGCGKKFFVEFGVGNGLENNTAFLLIQDWQGVWIEADAKCGREIKKQFADPLEKGKLKLRQSFIDRDNIENIFKEMQVPAEFDLLSIDIDGNDYWVWKAIVRYKPRVVVIEYNALYGPSAPWIMEYNEGHSWDGTSCYHGASLKALETLGSAKGYRLVGCDITGMNAFFVQADLVKNLFEEPFTSENHYEAPKYYGLSRKTGNQRRFGKFTQS